MAPKSNSPFFGSDYFVVQPHGLSQFQTMTAYLGGSAFQTIVDNPVTAYRQLVQQYAKDLSGKTVDPRVASAEAKAVFRANPVAASMSGVGPRLVGVGFKRVPKFGCLLGISFLSGNPEPGMVAATGASILSAPFINPIRMIEKQQRAYFKQTGAVKPIMEILRESAAQNFKPLFRGTVPLMGHSLASATLGLVGQPKLQKRIQKELGEKSQLGRSVTGLISSAIVSPIYVIVTNPLSRLEVIMQTSSIKGKSISTLEAVKEVIKDSAEYGLRGVFRGQGIGIVKAVISLTLFHEGRLMCMDGFKNYNLKKGLWTQNSVAV
uniref:Mitochondrial carrier protein n=1 Tax=Aplanochytrium stocchinoi TaxID=215587 RepID=A0A7S3LPS4_9STRA|mmetsp:Transcript_7325/g.9279  ORF Transcript_7325/g.9279 Transcript_7325/m.9279 type:complete len:321 (+) Transcript_7325:189-1151(+)|eukprot:CAMPEP_0204824096 /NCGR_PEP_ID=MMETSP1346-20131115/2139_1 /ASSEMBLY_ACC=CAM_ASM_000771 /TAXON_ID=215587 /ORGANISM="Aplanochytrium stocchinoi, Strain GSBS06" /LENGTH=320 /DNA_ID=CAMNT_0051951057 /DNA_START=301 /DNA_END=1263 /DNA_ORIENTATION=-